MTLEKKTNHVEEALTRPIDFFKNKPIFRAFLSVFIEQIQDLEDSSFQMLLNRWLDSAEGVQLDGIGDIVGEARLGRNDADYLLAIKVRIQFNFSNATPEDIYTALVNFNDRRYEYIPAYPAAFTIRLLDALSPSDPTPDEYNAFLNTINAGGVKAWFLYSEVDDVDTFTTASGDVDEASTTQGTANDAGTIGGSLADVAG